METILGCCAGLDVHKDTVEACVRRVEKEGGLYQQTRHWGTMTRELVAMAEWLRAEGVTQVAMESTGVYWKPIFNILESAFQVLLVNARDLKHVPGHKTDVKDCQWIAQLLQHGLLKGSFIPPRAQRELRDLTRQRAQVLGEHSRISNRMQKVLEDANIKLGSVASDVVGASGRLMLQAIIGGETNPETLADFAKLRLREKIPPLRQALEARSPSIIAGCWVCCGINCAAAKRSWRDWTRESSSGRALRRPPWRNWMPSRGLIAVWPKCCWRKLASI